MSDQPLFRKGNNQELLRMFYFLPSLFQQKKGILSYWLYLPGLSPIFWIKSLQTFYIFHSQIDGDEGAALDSQGETTLRFVFIRKGRKSEYPEMIGIVLS